MNRSAKTDNKQLMEYFSLLSLSISSKCLDVEIQIGIRSNLLLFCDDRCLFSVWWTWSLTWTISRDCYILFIYIHCSSFRKGLCFLCQFIPGDWSFIFYLEAKASFEKVMGDARVVSFFGSLCSWTYCNCLQNKLSCKEEAFVSPSWHRSCKLIYVLCLVSFALLECVSLIYTVARLENNSVIFIKWACSFPDKLISNGYISIYNLSAYYFPRKFRS